MHIILLKKILNRFLNELTIERLNILGVYNAVLHPYYTKAITLGVSGQSDFFLVNAMRAASAAKKTVPELWLPLAQKRFEQLASEPSNTEERKRLAILLYIWYKKIKDEKNAVEVIKQSGIKKPTFSRFVWPGQRWIPKLSN